MWDSNEKVAMIFKLFNKFTIFVYSDEFYKFIISTKVSMNCGS